MKIIQKIAVIFAVSFSLIIPQIAAAQTSSSTSVDTCADLKRRFENAGGTNAIAGIPQYCTVGSVYTKFINFALYAIGIVAVIAIIYGGYLYMTARGNAEQVKKGRSVLTWAIIGLIVVLAAAVIVNIVVSGLVENRFV